MRRSVGTTRRYCATIGTLVLVLLAFVGGRAVAGGAAEPEEFPEAGGDRVTVSIAIEGMNGVLTAAAIEGALSEVDGVVATEVSYEARRATLLVDESAVEPSDLVALILSLGDFAVRLLPEHTRTTTIRVPGLATREIGNHVNRVLQTVPGIVGGTIRSQYMAVDYDERITDPEDIAEALVVHADLDASDIAIPATDAPAPEESAQTVIRVEDMHSYAAATRVAQAVALPGIADGEFDLEAGTITCIYRIGELTTPEILEAVSVASAGDTTVVTVDKAGKPVGLNTYGWFVMAVSTIGLLIVLGVFVFIRRRRR